LCNEAADEIERMWNVSADQCEQIEQLRAELAELKKQEAHVREV
jgi:hypothetical protein